MSEQQNAVTTPLPHAHDVALGVLLQVGLHYPGCVLPVGHDAAARTKARSGSAGRGQGQLLCPGHSVVWADNCAGSTNRRPHVWP